MKHYVLIAALGAALFGCGDATAPTVRREMDPLGLAVARERWRSHGVHDYKYTLGYDCFCVAHQLVVTVLHDTIIQPRT